MKSHISAQQAVVVAKAIGKTCRSGIKQDKVGIQRGGVDKNDGCKKINGFLAPGVDDFYADSFSPGLVVEDGLHDGKWAQRQLAGLLGPGQSSGVAGEIATKRAPPLAEQPVLAWHASLFPLDCFGFGQMFGAGTDDVAAGKMSIHGPAEVILYCVERISGEKFPIGQLRYSVPVAGYAGKFFDIAIPGCKIPITDRPVDGKSVPCWALKVKI